MLPNFTDRHIQQAHISSKKRPKTVSRIRSHFPQNCVTQNHTRSNYQSETTGNSAFFFFFKLVETVCTRQYVKIMLKQIIKKKKNF